jgi:hypothetical protein
MSLDVLLGKLHKVKRTGSNAWMACCPVHADKTPSLSIRDAGDGRLLINCLASCDTREILQAVGMDWEDVMPPKQASYQAPIKQRVYPSDALKAIQSEARIVMIAASTMASGEDLTVGDILRLRTAMERINSALELANV